MPDPQRTPLPKASGKPVVLIDGSGSMQQHLGRLSEAVLMTVTDVGPGVIVMVQNDERSIREFDWTAVDSKFDWRHAGLPFGGFDRQVIADVESMNPKGVTFITDDSGPHRDPLGVPRGWRVIELPELTPWLAPSVTARSTKPIATMEILSDIETRINDAMKLDSLERRTRHAVEIHAELKRYARTPAVVALTRRLFVEALNIDPENLVSSDALTVDTPEPEPRTTSSFAPASTRRPEPEVAKVQTVIMLLGEDDNLNEPAVTEAFLFNGTPEEASPSAERIAALRGVDFDVLTLLPLPVEVVAIEIIQEARDRVREVLRGHPGMVVDAEVIVTHYREALRDLDRILNAATEG